MPDPVALFDLLAARRKPAARAVLARVHGGSPRRSGAALWVGADGERWGSITVGGCAEDRIAGRAADLLARRSGGSMVPVALGSDGIIDPGLGCAGHADVWVEVADFGDPACPVRRAHAELRDHAGAGRSAVLAKSDPAPDWLPAAVGAAARALLSPGSAAHTARVGDGAAGGESWLLERTDPPADLLIFGAGPIAEPLAAAGAAAGFRVRVIDHRAALLGGDRFPDVAERIVARPGWSLDRVAWGPRTWAVVVSHNPADEVAVIEHALAAGAAYVGFVGSRERGARVLAYLAASGVPADRLARVRVPVGLDLGAESPGEIAISIAAELLAARTGRSVAPLPNAAPPQ